MSTAASPVGSGPEGVRNTHDETAQDALVEAWRARMRRTDIADELFLPLERGAWHNGVYRVPPEERARARTRVTGVRFHAADPDRNNLEPERATQTDFHRLLTSLIRLREESGQELLGLSGETLRTSRRGDVPRLRFGLVRGDEGSDRRLAADDEAARRAYRGVRRSIANAGFVVLEPTETFDPTTGLRGLREWTDRLRLRKKKNWLPWLLLLPLLLLPFLLPRCEMPASFFGAPIETRSFVLLIDRSGSMEQHFAALHTEAQRVLGVLDRVGGCSVDVIAYDQDAVSCLGAIRPITPDTRTRIDEFLATLEVGGGTNLRSGMEVAAKEIAALGQATTLVILTDAEDGSIRSMVDDHDRLIPTFGEVETKAYGLTPQFYVPSNSGDAATDVQPHNDAERDLAALSELLGGRFGPSARGR